MPADPTEDWEAVLGAGGRIELGYRLRWRLLLFSAAPLFVAMGIWEVVSGAVLVGVATGALFAALGVWGLLETFRAGPVVVVTRGGLTYRGLRRPRTATWAEVLGADRTVRGHLPHVVVFLDPDAVTDGRKATILLPALLDVRAKHLARWIDARVA